MDETTNPETGVEGTAAPEELEDQSTDVSDELADSEQPDDAETAAPDVEDVEFDGKKYAVPKEIKDALLRQADYTRKTQEVAEQRKQIEARAAEVQQLAKLSDEHVNDLAYLKNVDAELAKYSNVDWQQLIQEDPATALQHRARFDDAREAKRALEARVSQHQARRSVEQQQATAKRFQEAEEALASDDKTWDATKSTALVKFIEGQYGFDKGELIQLMSPKFARAMRDAQVGRQALTKAVAKPTPEPVKPAVVLKASTPQKQVPHAALPIDEWMRRRNAQLSKSKGR